MKRNSLAAILAIFLVSALCCLGSGALAAESGARSGSGRLTGADKSLNASYKQIKKLYASDLQFLAKLTASQRAWLKFRDAELDAAGAVTDTFEAGGTMQRLDMNDRRMSLIRARTIDLMEYNRQLSN